jgi:hypothetical protein
MAEQAQATDMGTGLAFVFGVIALLGALASTVASYQYSLNEGGGLLLISGIGIAVAMLAGGLAVAALHAFGE